VVILSLTLADSPPLTLLPTLAFTYPASSLLAADPSAYPGLQSLFRLTHSPTHPPCFFTQDRLAKIEREAGSCCFIGSGSDLGHSLAHSPTHLSLTIYLLTF
jgi:hypothetical protein